MKTLRKIFTLITLISIQCLGSNFIFAQDEKSYLTAGLNLTQEGSFQEAIENFSKVIQLNNHSEEAYYYRAEAYFGFGKYEEAIMDLDKAISLAPNHISNYSKRAEVKMAQRRYEEAVSDYNEAIQRAGSSEKFYVARAECFLYSNHLAKAIIDCDKALSIIPNYAPAFAIRGLVHQAQGNSIKAMNDLQTAIQLTSRETKYKNYLANIYVQEKQYEKALDLFNQALTINPKDYLAYYLRSETYLISKKYALAKEDANKAILHNRRHYAAYLIRGVAYFQIGNFIQSEQDFDMYLKNISTSKEYAHIAKLVSEHIIDKNLLLKSENWISKAVSLDNSYENNLLYAKILNQSGKTTEANLWADKAILIAKQTDKNSDEAKYLLTSLNVSASVDRVPPSIQIIAPFSSSRGFVLVDNVDKINIVGKVSDESGIARVLVNGNIARLEVDGSFNGETVLENNETLIILIATDKKGNSSEQQFVVKKKVNTNNVANNTQNQQKSTTTTSTPILGKHRALLFATNDYDYWMDLINPLYDASSIAKDLEEIYGFEVEVVENPTMEKVILKLREYAQYNYSEKDELFVFFAGHGHYDEIGGGSLVTKDSKLTDPARTTYLNYAQLNTIVNNINCEHILMVVDACFSGTFDPIVASRGQEDEITQDKIDFINRKLRYKTRRYIASGGKEYVSDGRPGQHSPFARKLLEAFRSEGGSDGILTVSEIMYYMQSVSPQPHTCEFGTNEPGSDFLFIKK